MPKVATYGQPRVSTQAVQGARAQGLPSSAFGLAPLAQGAANLATGLQEMQQRIDTTAAEEAALKFEREKNDLFFNPDTGYFNSQGRNAYDGAKGITESLQALERKYAETLESPAARQAFERVAQKHLSNAQVDIMRHASQGLKAWETATLEAQVENTIENASLYWADSERLGVQRALGRQALLDAADRQGITGDALNERLQTYESSFTKAAISSALNSGSAAAEALMKQIGNRLEGPDFVQVEKAIATKKKAEQTQFQAQYATAQASKIVNQYDTRQDVMDAVNRIGDPELRDKTMREAMYQYGQKKQAEKELQSESFEAAENHLLDGGTAESFRAIDPEGWERLTVKQKRKLEEGEPVVTDWNTFTDLMTMSDDEIKKVDITEHFPNLAPAQRTQVINRQKSALGKGGNSTKVDAQVGRTRAAQIKSTVTQLFGKPSKQDLVKVDQFHALLDSEVQHRESQKGSPLTSEEFTALLGDFTRKVVVTRSVGGIDWLAPDKEMTIDDLMGKLEPGELDQLREFLQSKNIPVTSENLINAYRQATQ